jgi:enoyl-CoA hydratase
MSIAAGQEASGRVSVVRTGAVARLTLERPQARNAINTAMAKALEAAVESLADASAVVVAATGPAFCAGLDLGEVRAGTMPSTGGIRALAASPAVVIGVVQGPAFAAGLDLALACDILYASPTALFADLHVKIGLPPPQDLVEALVRRVGRSRATLLLLDPVPVDAARAQSWGLVDVLLPEGEALHAALALAEAVAAAERPVVERILTLLRTPA